MVECVNGRIVSVVLEINVYSHRALEQLLRGFNTAYNGQLQRVLEGKTSNRVVVDHLKATPDFANPAPHDRAIPCYANKSTPYRRRGHGGLTTRHLILLCHKLGILADSLAAGHRSSFCASSTGDDGSNGGHGVAHVSLRPDWRTLVGGSLRVFESL